jgi:hypothetical protein
VKLSKAKLKELIRESLQELEAEQPQTDPTRLKTGTMSTGARKKASRDRITGDASEFTSQERNIIDQLEQFISTLAATPGVDLMKHKALLQRVIKLLQQKAANKTTQPQQGEA